MGTDLHSHREVAVSQILMRRSLSEQATSPIIVTTPKKLSLSIKTISTSDEPDSKKIEQIKSLLDICNQDIDTFIRCQAFIAITQIVYNHPQLLHENKGFLNTQLNKFKHAINFDNNALGPEERSNLYFRFKQLGLVCNGFEEQSLNYLRTNLDSFNSFDLTLYVQGLSLSKDPKLDDIQLIINEIKNKHLNTLDAKSCLILVDTLKNQEVPEVISFLRLITTHFLRLDLDCQDLVSYIVFVVDKPVDHPGLYKKLISTVTSQGSYDSQKQMSLKHTLHLIASNENYSFDFKTFIENINVQNCNLSLLLSLGSACYGTVHKQFAQKVYTHVLNELSSYTDIENKNPFNDYTQVDLVFTSHLFATYGVRSQTTKFMSNLIDRFCQNIDPNNPSYNDLKPCLSILTDMVHTRCFHPTFLNLVKSLVSKNILALETDDITVYLWATTRLNFNIGEELATKLTNKFLAEDKQKKLIEQAIVVAWSLVLFHKNLAIKILGTYNDKIDITKLGQVHRTQFLQTHYLCEPNPNDTQYASQFNNACLTSCDNSFENEVMQILNLFKNALKRNLHIQRRTLLLGIQVDFIITAQNRRIILECDGDSSHLLSNGRPQGKDLIQDMIFKKLGYEVVHLSDSEWAGYSDKTIALMDKLSLNLRKKPTI